MASRRQLLSTSIVTSAGAILPPLVGRGITTAHQDQAPAEPMPSGIGTAAHPAWSFVVLAVADPYEGSVDRLVNASGDNRVVAVEAIIDNASDQPLSFAAVDIRLRTGEGIEHRGGSIIGDEPRLSGRNLKPGERARGWVWFDVPRQTTLVEVVLAGPAPQWRVSLPD